MLDILAISVLLWASKVPKQTAKYATACRKADDLNISIGSYQEEIYQSLNSQGFYWNSKEKTWGYLDEDTDPPTELIKIRIWTDSRFLEKTANDCIEGLSKQGIRLVEKSDIFTCPPPKQLEAIIYLTFQKEPENVKNPQSFNAVLSPRNQ